VDSEVNRICKTALSFDFQEHTMSGANEKWKELCEQVIAERDPKRLTELVDMLNDELEKREFGKRIALAQPNPSKNQEPSAP
jgi:hypothetical protein